MGPHELRQLRNFGNTCFINATLQCMFNCFALQNFSSIPLGVLRDFFWVAAAVRGYLPASVESPANQYGLLRFDTHFPLNQQQDAMEYMQRLFDETGDILTTQFKFTLVTSVMCGTQCSQYNHEMNAPAPTHHTSDSVYSYLSVTIDPTLGRTTLADLLDTFFRPEHLPADYICSFDSTLSPNSTKLTAWKTYPSILLLQLGRFVVNTRTSQTQKNGYTRIEVPLVLSPDFSDVENRYHLIGVVFHHGRSLTEGHYTACTLDKYHINGVAQERWNLHNDSKSTLIPDIVQYLRGLNRDVYMLFYRRAT